MYFVYLAMFENNVVTACCMCTGLIIDFVKTAKNL